MMAFVCTSLFISEEELFFTSVDHLEFIIVMLIIILRNQIRPCPPALALHPRCLLDSLSDFGTGVTFGTTTSLTVSRGYCSPHRIGVGINYKVCVRNLSQHLVPRKP